MSTPARPPGESGQPQLQVALSWLEHYTYCPRQCALIVLEDAFTDDAATTRGTLLHQRVDTPGNKGRGTVRTLHALPVWHDDLGLTGTCDTVELHDNGTILPVEHKSGRYHPHGPADVQAAAQAICLQQMFQRPVPQAAVYSAADRRRHTVTIIPELHQRVLTTTRAVRELLTTRQLPPPPPDNRPCRRCSMAGTCIPSVLTRTRHYQHALNDLYTLPDEEPTRP
ncbi:CRISPR-associated protein Cas4 [Kitasatospora sp. YST-16]|uniref:CRISPR-associated protein Cas4 n=1 Tax=Kitasatospora sp. YST-16 TaxID=2998080 RepID=UPI0022840907|nr:CRISPR-associated protein Cas4 [Kitasatospora sp. YST-16]WAL70107.1 CRISPR-associated protein Cas4 [Kitasatospora sp. YST-16]WNW36147.1 CRISPR-associated protein Cas4 [Streptomyces sp. Li-HN-5-13]